MPSVCVRQPNGLYARFSTVVDNFTHLDHTREEIWEVFRDEAGVRVADKKLDNAENDKLPSAIYDENAAEGLRRWMGGLKTVESVHGKDARREVEDMIGDS